MKNSLKFAFLKFVNHQQLIPSGQKILIAVSGGIDSMVLLHLMLAWQKYFKTQIGVVHFNHHLRGEDSDKDEAFVKNICEKHRIPFFPGEGDVKKYARENKYSIEEAARLMRETCFEKIREKEKFDVIATAHNLNDQAETLLMRLLSGTGLEGLAGIRLRREGYIRPLLFAERAAIENHAAMNNIEYREDLSNRDMKFVRNKIRRQLLPYLQEEFNLSHLNSFLNLGLMIQDWLPSVYEQAEQLFKEGVIVETQNKIRLDITTYTGYFSQIRFRVLEKILSIVSGEDVKLSYNRYYNFSNWLNKQGDSGKLLFNKNIRVTRLGQKLVFEKAEESSKILKLEVKKA